MDADELFHILQGNEVYIWQGTIEWQGKLVEAEPDSQFIGVALRGPSSPNITWMRRSSITAIKLIV
jgi:hypothetical protein